MEFNILVILDVILIYQQFWNTKLIIEVWINIISIEQYLFSIPVKHTVTKNCSTGCAHEWVKMERNLFLAINFPHLKNTLKLPKNTDFENIDSTYSPQNMKHRSCTHSVQSPGDKQKYHKNVICLLVCINTECIHLIYYPGCIINWCFMTNELFDNLV